MEKLAIVIPVYNENQIINLVCDEWVKMLNTMNIDYCIHFYNDGSKDNSLEILQKKSQQYPFKVIVHTKENSGHGPTLLMGYCECSAQNYDWIFQIDSDNEMGAKDFIKLWENRHNYDFLIGKRHNRKQTTSRKIISLISRLTITIFYKKGVYDVNSPYRLMRNKSFKELFKSIPPNTFAPNLIISGLANNMRFLEIPVEQQNRQTGEVSIKHWKLLKAAFRSFYQVIVYRLKNI